MTIARWIGLLLLLSLAAGCIGVSRPDKPREVVGRVAITVPSDGFPARQTSPGDDGYSWTLDQIRADEAWRAVGQGDGIVVAIIDFGIHFTHPGLDDPNIWVDGWDFLSDSAEAGAPYGFDADSDPGDDHGTVVAAIIGTRKTDGENSLMGVAPGVQLMPVRVFSDTVKTSADARIAQAIRFAVDNGADVINLSLGKPTDCGSVLEEALDAAWNAGVPVVAAAGNRGDNPVFCPARHPTVIAVGATGGDGRWAAYSSWGPGLDLAAPGVGVPMCSRSGPVDPEVCHIKTGTSFAAPRVSGVVALMLAGGASRDPDQIKHLLQMTAFKFDDSGWDEHTGYGVVDAYAAVSAGTPVVFVAEQTSTGLRAVAPTAVPREGGEFRLTDVPSGTWVIGAWVDVDGDGALSPGDFYGEFGPIHIGAQLTTLPTVLKLEPFDGAMRDMRL